MNVNDLPDRLRSRVVVDESGCWIWVGSIDAYGYGRFASGQTPSGNSKKHKAHRLTYEALVGPIPEGLVIDHLCRRTACVRPDHLEPVINRENILRGISPQAGNARKTHCPYGHEYTADNTCLSSGRRYCRACFRRKNWANRGVPRKLAPAAALDGMAGAAVLATGAEAQMQGVHAASASPNTYPKGQT